ncbi:MAG: hypothetical protein ACM3KD_11370 [Hyphomicrobiaceae bacterium]
MQWILIPLVLALAACDRTPPQPETEHKASPVFESQIQTVRKAKAVAGQVMDAADAQRKQVDEATQQSAN